MDLSLLHKKFQYKIKDIKERKEKKKFTCLAVNDHNYHTVAETSLTHRSVVVLTEEPVVF
jgi:hypothetical protein